MNKYSELLKNQIWASVVAIALILALSLILFMLNKKHFFNDMGKIGKIAVNIFVIAVILLTSFYFFFSNYKLTQRYTRTGIHNVSR